MMNQTHVKSIYTLLNDTKVNGHYTHVSMGNNKGRFYLSSSKDDTFFNIYQNLKDDNIKLCLAEKQGDYTVLLGDIDIKIPVETSSVKGLKRRTLYTSEELQTVVECFQTSIKETVVNWTNNSLICVVLEKKPYYIDGNLKNGFHLHFPYLFVEGIRIKNTIIPRIKEKIKDVRLKSSGKKLFSNHTDSPDKFVDDVTDKCWLMYGSAKNELLKPYTMTEIYNHDLKIITPVDAFTADRFYTKNEQRIHVDESNVLDLLPRLLSISPIKKKIYHVKSETPIDAPNKARLRQDLKSDDVDPNSLTIAASLLKIINPLRANEYHTWWEIGIILYNVGNGSPEAFKLWDKWSTKSDKYDEDKCIQVWNSMKPKNGAKKSLASLKYFAKLDNQAKYIEFVEKQHGLNLEQDFIQTEILTTDATLARVLLDVYSGEYIYSDLGWHKFNGIIWKEVKVLKNFRFKLEQMSGMYKKFRNKILELLYPKEEEEEDDEKEELDKKDKVILVKKLSDINKAVNKLENYAPQNGILKMCEVLFYDEQFSELLDQDPQLIAFTNGVFDCERLCFRQGLHTDYLSKTLGVEYNEKLTMSSSRVQELEHFLFKIFPDANIRKYFIDQACEFFRGGNRDKIAMFWTGTGNNGKSVTQKLFETMIGKNMAIKLSTSLLTDRIQPGQPNPQVTRLRGGVRWGVFDEFRKSEQIDCGSLKVLTGEDSLPCRDLFQRGQDSTDFTPMFKMLCICNELPGLKDVDDATWDRIRIIPFESKFVSQEKCPPTEEEQIESKRFLCDTEITLPKRMKKLAVALGWYLAQVLIDKETKRRAGTYDATIPDKVNDAKIKYQTKCDVLAYFMEDSYIKTDVDKDRILFDDMYINFKVWYINAFSGKITHNKKEFIDMVKHKYKLLETDKLLKGYAPNRIFIEN
jgi:P4 family phage/plasmid primase-like protien